MVAGFHLIWSAYGWWLPNDPRGGSSHEIRVEQIADLGDLHYGRKPVQPPGWQIQHFWDAGALSLSGLERARNDKSDSSFRARGIGG